MENVEQLCDELRELPREEALVRLYELTERYGVVWASAIEPRSESDRHMAAHGHRLRYGCCGESSRLVA